MYIKMALTGKRVGSFLAEILRGNVCLSFLQFYPRKINVILRNYYSLPALKILQELNMNTESVRLLLMKDLDIKLSVPSWY